jgi:hypothetical protein
VLVSYERLPCAAFIDLKVERPRKEEGAGRGGGMLTRLIFVYTPCIGLGNLTNACVFMLRSSTCSFISLHISQLKLSIPYCIQVFHHCLDAM